MPVGDGVGEHGFAIRERLRERAADSLRRTLRPADRVDTRVRFGPDPGGARPTFPATETLVFAANNYLGLTADDRVQAAAAQAARDVGTGAGASRLVVGDTVTHRELERELAAAKDTERALVFSSGYAANVGTIAALAPDVVFSDTANHASIIDGCRLSGADIEIYDHADPDALAARLDARADGAAPDDSWLVVTDSVFSMSGEVAPLAAICDHAERHGAWVMADEAHATGLYDDGGGIVQREGLGDRVQIQLGTLSKALASQGGYVAGSEPLVEYLAEAARSFVFSTGLAPPAAAAAGTALEIAREDAARRQRLHAHATRLREGLATQGYTVGGEAPIVPVYVDDRERALALAEAVEARGVLAPAIRPPTVSEGESRLRVAPMATHTDDAIDRCLAAFETAGREVGLL
jgi:8-amino-7-oxononanoate synthase